MEAAGYIELVPVDDDALDSAFAAERGIEPGGMMWQLTDAGRALRWKWRRAQMRSLLAGSLNPMTHETELLAMADHLASVDCESGDNGGIAVMNNKARDIIVSVLRTAARPPAGREEIARIIAGPLCDATKAEHSVMRNGRYSFCTQCGETITKSQIGIVEARNKADAILALGAVTDAGETIKPRGGIDPDWHAESIKLYRQNKMLRKVLQEQHDWHLAQGDSDFGKVRGRIEAVFKSTGEKL